MEIFLKTTACILITVLLGILLGKQDKNYVILLSLAACAMTLMAAGTYLRTILDFFSKLIQIGQLSNDLLGLLLKITGIGLLSEIACFVCVDAGNKALEKTLQIMTVMVILWLALPLLEELLQMMQTLLETI